jgi:hypothetical protein
LQSSVATCGRSTPKSSFNQRSMLWSLLKDLGSNPAGVGLYG